MEACPFRTIIVLYRMLPIDIISNGMISVCDTVSIFPPLKIFLSTGNYFSNNGLDNLPWSSFT